MWDIHDPIELFRQTFAEAGQGAPFDATACALATSTPEGKPSQRFVLLKEVDVQGRFVFFTNYGSRKARELLANPCAALCFYWPWTGFQVRIEGGVSRLDDAASDAYFASRPRASRIGAWASRQSEELESQAFFEARLQRFEAEFAGREVERPPFWGGFALQPERIEFWHEGAYRLHQRRVFLRQGEAWESKRLFP